MTTSETGGVATASGGHTAMKTTGGTGGRDTGAGGATSSGGKGGNGGGAANGGAGGRPSTGGIPNDAGGPDGSSPFDGGCASYSTLYTFSWGYNGGLVAYVDTSRLDTPTVYTHSRDQVRNGMGTIMCQTQVAGCPSPLLAEINAGLESTVVMNALRAHTVYGVDSRPVDGSVFRVTVGNDYVDVGGPCGGSGTGCIAIPPVVQQLVDALKAVDAQELAKKACVDVFGAPATP